MSENRLPVSSEVNDGVPDGTSAISSIGDLDAFAAFEHNYLLQCIYLGDIRGAAVFAALGGAMAFYFTRPTISPSAESILFDALTWLWLFCNIAGFSLAGVALCPFPRVSHVPRKTGDSSWARKQREYRTANPAQASVTHYFDVASFEDSDKYVSQIARIHGRPVAHLDGLTLEKLRECYQLALILKGKMQCVFWSYIMSAAALFFLVVALGFVDVAKAPSVFDLIARLMHVVHTR